VVLRESTSTLRFCSSLKRSLASSGTNLTLVGSSKIAAAMARQKSTSKPDQLPFSSAAEKPGRPVLTPHSTASRRTVLFSVCVSYRSKTIAATATAIATAKPIKRPDRKVSAKSLGMFYLASGCTA
jgi:hypothetical protein